MYNALLYIRTTTPSHPEASRELHLKGVLLSTGNVCVYWYTGYCACVPQNAISLPERQQQKPFAFWCKNGTPQARASGWKGQLPTARATRRRQRHRTVGMTWSNGSQHFVGSKNTQSPSPAPTTIPSTITFACRKLILVMSPDVSFIFTLRLWVDFAGSSCSGVVKQNISGRILTRQWQRQWYFIRGVVISSVFRAEMHSRNE